MSNHMEVETSTKVRLTARQRAELERLLDEWATWERSYFPPSGPEARAEKRRIMREIEAVFAVPLEKHRKDTMQ